MTIVFEEFLGEGLGGRWQEDEEMGGVTVPRRPAEWLRPSSSRRTSRFCARNVHVSAPQQHLTSVVKVENWVVAAMRVSSSRERIGSSSLFSVSELLMAVARRVGGSRRAKGVVKCEQS